MLKKALIVFSLWLTVISPALAYDNPGPATGFVNGFVQVLSSEQKQNLENKLLNFEKESSNEVAVAIISSLDGDTIENFALELFADWQIGKKNNDNGVLILVAIEDRQMRIEVGYGLEGALTDAQSSWIINQVMKPAFQQGDYYAGLDQAVDKIIAASQGEYLPSESATTEMPNVGNWLWFFIFIFMWLTAILSRSKSWWLGGVFGGIGGVIVGLFNGFLFFGLIATAVLIPLGLFFDYLVSKKYQASKASGHVPWWIGGGRGGGFGGGFGGFGGGGSGGGGASGRW